MTISPMAMLAGQYPIMPLLGSSIPTSPYQRAPLSVHVLISLSLFSFEVGVLEKLIAVLREELQLLQAIVEGRRGSCCRLRPLWRGIGGSHQGRVAIGRWALYYAGIVAMGPRAAVKETMSAAFVIIQSRS